MRRPGRGQASKPLLTHFDLSSQYTHYWSINLVSTSIAGDNQAVKPDCVFLQSIKAPSLMGAGALTPWQENLLTTASVPIADCLNRGVHPITVGL
jgi:hypothetical protein